MKKIVGFTLLIILISYLLALSKYLLIEEITGLFIITVIVVIIISSLAWFMIRFFKKTNYSKFIFNSLLAACFLQILILGLILWSVIPRYFSREQVISDIDYSIKIMEDVHPDLYTLISKEIFYQKTDSLKRLLPEEVSDVAAYKTLNKIFAQLKDGHTRASWSFFLKRFNVVFRKTLPYKFGIKDEKLFVAENYFYRNRIPIGSEIIKINGKPAGQCLQEVSQLFSYENIPFRNAILQTPLYWGLWNDFKDFEITYITPGSKTIETIKASSGLISNVAILKDIASIGNDYSFKILPRNTGYMEINSFKNLDKFKIFLDSTFTLIQAKNIKDLVIDIRKNSGGNSSLGDELMQYISKTDFRTFDSAMIKISSELTAKGEFNWIGPIKRKIGSTYNLNDSSKTKLRINPLRFGGQVYLLTGGYSFSSATNLASVFQCYKVGKIIGTETGGLTVSFGEEYSFTLPNTKMDMNVSCKKFVNACGIDNRRGVIPDHIVEDKYDGVDKVLEFTLGLIKQN